MTNFLIIGGLGYVGSVIYDHLKQKGLDVDILDNHLYIELNPSNPFIKADVRNKDKIHEIIKNYDIIINLAAIVGDPACLIDTDLAIEINCIGTRNVAEICDELDKYIIHSSTCSIYGSEPNTLVSEEDNCFPIDFYGQTKYTQERLVAEVCGDNACILRFGTVYGLSPRMRYDLVINSFIGKAFNVNKITVFGGEQQRPFVHIKDIARAVLHVINNDVTGIYNLRGENLSIIELSNIIKDTLNCKVDVDKNIIDKRSYIVDNSKLIETGFDYKYTIADAAREIAKSPTIEKMNDKIYSNLKLAESLKISRNIKQKDIQIINGGFAVDDRGWINFANDFNFSEYGVKRFYQVQNFSTSTIRAWHAHKNEAKFVYVAEGSAIFGAVKLDNFDTPSKDLEINRFILSEKNPEVLFIPPGYANGFRALEKETRVIFFSTNTLKESQKDDYRFPADYWGEEFWEVKNR